MFLDEETYSFSWNEIFGSVVGFPPTPLWTECLGLDWKRIMWFLYMVEKC